MSNFAESHSLPTYKERRAAKMKGGATNFARWLRTDKIVDEVYVDIINGFSKSDIVQKMSEGLYENQNGKPIKERTALEYLAAAQQRLAFDFEKNAETLRADLYAKLTSVYQEAIQKGDRYNAIQAIQTLMKLTGVALDKPQNNIQINANKEGININFGFKKEDETNDD